MLAGKLVSSFGDAIFYFVGFGFCTFCFWFVLVSIGCVICGVEGCLYFVSAEGVVVFAYIVVFLVGFWGVVCWCCAILWGGIDGYFL